MSEGSAAVNEPRETMAERVMRLTGDEWCGHDAPPGGAHNGMNVSEPHDGVVRVIVSLNDGHEVGIGWPNEWHVIMRTETARLFALWVLKEWVRRWFGLRDALYYRALSAKGGKGWNRIGPRRARHARRVAKEVPS